MKNMKKIMLLAVMALVLCAELAAQANQSAWTVQKKENEDYTSYLFISKGSGEHFLFVGYDKYKSIGGSCVRAGVYWVPKAVDVGGTYDIKDDEGTKETKEFSWAWWSYTFGWGILGPSMVKDFSPMEVVTQRKVFLEMMETPQTQQLHRL